MVSTWLGDHQGRPSAPLIHDVTIWRVTNVITITIQLQLQLNGNQQCHLSLKSSLALWCPARLGVVNASLLYLYQCDIVSRFNIKQRLFIVLYADDILLIAPSLNKLQLLFRLCRIELAWLDMSINTKKSCYMSIGNRFDIVVLI